MSRVWFVAAILAGLGGPGLTGGGRTPVAGTTGNFTGDISCAGITASGFVTLQSSAQASGFIGSKAFYHTMTNQTVPDDGAGTAASATVLATSGGAVLITCSDANGCNLTLGETSVNNGQVLYVVNMSANAVNMADTATVSETTGAVALGQYDSITYLYATDRWIQISASNN